MNNAAKEVFKLSDGEGRETDKPSFVSIGDLVEQIARRVEQTRIRNDNDPGWDAAVDALPVKKEGS